MARNRDGEEGAQLPEQRIDWRRVLWLMGRQRTIVAACVLVGALLPAILVLLRSTSYTATSIVLVPGSSASNAAGGSTVASGNGNVTDSELAVSSAVLGPAGSSVTPQVTPLVAQHRVTATPVATNLVQITATGSSSGRPRPWQTPWPRYWSTSSRQRTSRTDRVPSQDSKLRLQR